MMRLELKRDNIHRISPWRLARQDYRLLGSDLPSADANHPSGLHVAVAKYKAWIAPVFTATRSRFIFLTDDMKTRLHDVRKMRKPPCLLRAQSDRNPDMSYSFYRVISLYYLAEIYEIISVRRREPKFSS